MADANNASRLPDPPNEYTRGYMSQLIRTIELLFTSLKTRRRIMGTTLNLSKLPTSSAGLASGDVWNDTGTLKIVP